MPRWSNKTDTAQPEIVEALRRAGCWVWVIGRPVDLLCWHPSFGSGNVKCIEVKTPRRTGNWSKDQRQLKQMEFIQVTGTKYATTPEQALHAVGLSGELAEGWSVVK